MNPQQIDVVRLETPQALFDGTDEVLSVVARRVRIGVIHGEGVLRGDDEMMSVACEPTAEDFFGLAPVVFVRGVEEVAASLRIGVEHGTAGSLVSTESPLLPKAHRSEAKLGHAQS